MVSNDEHATTVLDLARRQRPGRARRQQRARDPAPRVRRPRDQIAGTWAVYKDVNETVSEDLARAESLSLPLVVILSLLIFGSVVAALMPAVVGRSR